MSARSTFDMGRQNGVLQRWYESGALELEMPYVMGVQEGTFKRYDRNGRLAAEGNLHEGRRQGIVRVYAADGSIDEAQSGVFENNARIGPLPR
jgi:antitoxin component YwqK of YwqJK toxin-antitoxin module